MPTRLILIRHGETDYTLQRRYCGHENIPLNANGIGQADRLRDRLKKIKADSVYSSDLKRAFQTARIIFQGKVIHKRTGLREINFGQLSGLTFEESGRLFPDIYKAWLSNPAKARIPEGENLNDFAERVENCISRIFKQNLNKTVALVSHGGTIRIIILKLLKQSLDDFWNIQQDLTALNIIEFENKTAKAVKVNDTLHLEGE